MGEAPDTKVSPYLAYWNSEVSGFGAVRGQWVVGGQGATAELRNGIRQNPAVADITREDAEAILWFAQVPAK